MGGQDRPVDSRPKVALPSPQSGEQQTRRGPLNVDVPPRDAAEAVTFATWASSPASPRAASTSCPGWLFSSRSSAQRLERAEGRSPPGRRADVVGLSGAGRQVRTAFEPGESMGSSALRVCHGPNRREGAGVRVSSGRRLDDGDVRAAAGWLCRRDTPMYGRAGRGSIEECCGTCRS